jgi:O-acetyl-ADP-ribose deacetylase (regulator of RNase III)
MPQTGSNARILLSKLAVEIDEFLDTDQEQYCGIVYAKGDCLITPDRFILHGVNSEGTMGAGIAAQIAKRWPKVNSDYKQWTTGQFRLGQTLTVAVGVDRLTYIINACTQTLRGCGFASSARNVEYDAVEASFMEAAKFVNEYGRKFPHPGGDQWPVSMPRVGAGLGGGRWAIIEAIVNTTFGDYDIPVTVWDLPPRKFTSTLGPRKFVSGVGPASELAPLPGPTSADDPGPLVPFHADTSN